MCYHVSTPDKEKFDAYLAEYAVENVAFNYFVNGFQPSLLPVTTNQNNRRIYNAVWGLVNPLTDDSAAAKAEAAESLNARNDRIFLTKYRNYIMNQRCLIWVDGFYERRHLEYQVPGRGTRMRTIKDKIPYYIYMREHQPFSFGGVYSVWQRPDNGQYLTTVSIITTEANKLLSEIHNSKLRMPFIVPVGDRDRWLSDLGKDEIYAMMKPYPDGILQAHTISKLYINSNINKPEVQEPFPYEVPGL